MAYTLETLYEIWADEDGTQSIEVGPDRDGLELIEIRLRDHETNKILDRILLAPDQAKLVAQALLKATEKQP